MLTSPGFSILHGAGMIVEAPITYMSSLRTCFYSLTASFLIATGPFDTNTVHLSVAVLLPLSLLSLTPSSIVIYTLDYG